MAGGFERIGDRRTYFPPFVNEIFGERPYWSCTFASLLNGVNVGAYGTKPATYAEVVRLARASGDADLRGGSRASHMIRALKVGYGYDARVVALPPDRVKHRLAHGWAMVAGVTYGDLPTRLRQGTFKDGHRVVLVGWDGDRTRILDPLRPHDHDWHGQWVTWNELTRAWWSSEQLWFKEGALLGAPKLTAVQPVDPVRSWRGDKGSVIVLRDPATGRVAKRLRLAKDVISHFDGLARLVPPAKSLARPVTLMRLTGGPHAGWLTNANAPGVHADTTVLSPEIVRALELRGQQQLYDSLVTKVDVQVLGPRPGGPPPA